MNKDLDERLVKNGEYRDAMNVQVITTDSSGGEGQAGTVQNIRGNRKVGESYSDNSSILNSTCIASIADEKSDNGYFFFATPLVLPDFAWVDAPSPVTYIDTIVEQDINGNTTPIVVDQFAIVDRLSGVLGNDFDSDIFETGWSELTVVDASRYRVGMTIKITDALGDPLNIKLKIKAIDGNTILLHEICDVNIIDLGAQWFIFEAERVLNFSTGNLHLPGDSSAVFTYITGINIIDNLLFWTDNHSEPKKINITRCKEGTDGWNHTKLFIEHPVNGNLVDSATVSYNLDTGTLAVDENEFVVDEDGNVIIDENGSSDPEAEDYNPNYGLGFENVNFGVPLENGSGISSDLKQSHITVIRKSPNTPPTIHMSDGIRKKTTYNFTHQFLAFWGDDSTTLGVGQSYSIQNDDFSSSNFLKNDIVIIRETLGSEIVTEGARIRAKFICYETNDGAEVVSENMTTDIIKIEIITPADLTNITTESGWEISIEDLRKPLFELKLVRFGYRYKYTDGEYSTFSPWSEVAFLPGRFDYTSSNGYNLGMVNTIKELTIKDFIPYRIPLDVVAVDILYKTTSSPNVYVVDTIDKEKSSEWKLFTPDGGDDTFEIKTGSLSITSEMIHRALPNNQMLRSWDNVPRFAKTQEIIGNRLVYGNYTQGYDIKQNINLTQEIVSTDEASVEKPAKSIKSLRDYKIGVVFGDRYGRETPVITSGYTVTDNTEDGYTSLTGDISVPKLLSANKNSFIVSQTWGDPTTNDQPPIWTSGEVSNDSWISYVKYFIKETSSEYYNLIMDRWYYSGDGVDETSSSIWLSFNSADRNKVDEDTYLILKNKNGSEEPVLTEARYKILAIENEAPEYIKTDLVTIGTIKNILPADTGETDDSGSNYQGTMWETDGTTSYFAAPTLLWKNTSMSFLTETWTNNGIGNTEENGLGPFGRDIKGKVQIRFIGTNVSTDGTITGQISSEWRTLTHYIRSETEADTPIVTIAWDKLWDEGDVNMYSRFTAANLVDSTSFNLSELQYYLEFRETIVTNKPEFDGKFFVKIQRDLTTDQNIQVLGSIDYVPVATHKLGYIASTYQNEHEQTDTVAGIDYTADMGVVDDEVETENWWYGHFDNWIDRTDTDYDEAINSEGLYNQAFAYAADSVTHNSDGAIGTAFTTGQCTNSTYEESLCSYPGLPHYNLWVGDVNNPFPLADVWSQRAHSPFGSASPNYNDMTRDFWLEFYEENYKMVFIDSVNMSIMNIIPGPDRGLLLANDLPEYGGPDGEDGSLAGEIPEVKSNLENGHFAKPINTIYAGEGQIPGGSSNGAIGGTMGSICLSWVGKRTSTEPIFFSTMKSKGTIFEFTNYPGVRFKTIGVLYQSDTDKQRNWWWNSQDNYWGTWTAGTTIDEDGNLVFEEMEYWDILTDWENPLDQLTLDNFTTNVESGWDHPNVRYTAWIEFRQMDDNGEITETGLDISQFDPRAHMHHDGRDHINVQILSRVATSLEGIEALSERGSCFETEPKESTDLDIYYEASPALPMRLNEENAFDFAPIGSKVTASRTSNQGNTNVRPYQKGRIDHRVGNIWFTRPDKSEYAIVSIVSTNAEMIWAQVVGSNPIEYALQEGSNFGDTELHRRDFAIGDKLHFEHKDGLVTSAVIKEMYKPIDPNEFTEIDVYDLQYGVVSGPKAFEPAESLTISALEITHPLGSLPIFSYTPGWGSAGNNIPEVGDVITSIQINDYEDNEGNPQPGFVVSFGTSSTSAPSGIQVLSLDVLSDDNTEMIFSSLPSGWSWEDIINVNDSIVKKLTGSITFQKNYGYYAVDIDVWNQPVKLGWHNCYSFGNGVESDRIRDDFNAPQLDNGVKVSTTFSGYKEETLGSGLIYSGLYNSTSQINALNEFNMAEKITKELNPSYGSIQALKSRDTDIVVFAEDKVLKVLANKDALYNADGNQQLTATDKVLGQTIPFAGDYGISQNPESLAWDQYRMYFTDRQRGAVLRLSQDGLTPISSVGMETWFKDNLRKTNLLLGTFDTTTGEYNLTLKTPPDISTTNKTVSFNEKSKGWVSFKSFIPSSGISYSGSYFTTNSNKIWEHGVSEDLSGSYIYRNKFYGNDPVNSSIEVLFNAEPGSVKTFRSINYEGSQAKVDKFASVSNWSAYTGNITFVENNDGIEVPQAIETNDFAQTDNEYYNLFNKQGWFIPHMHTDLQDGSVPEFKNKEGKWFNKISGKTNFSDLDTSEFTVQGIGTVTTVTSYINEYTPSDDECVDGNGIVVDCSDDNCVGENCTEVVTYIYGCTDPLAVNYNSDAEFDDGGCVYTYSGCMDPLSYNFDSNANVDDGSCVPWSLVGCTDVSAINYCLECLYSGTNVFDNDGNPIDFIQCNTYSDEGQLNCGCTYAFVPLEPCEDNQTYNDVTGLCEDIEVELECECYDGTFTVDCCDSCQFDCEGECEDGYTWSYEYGQCREDNYYCFNSDALNFAVGGIIDGCDQIEDDNFPFDCNIWNGSNYNPDPELYNNIATNDNDNLGNQICWYSPEPIVGCMDPLACNYNVDAETNTYNDGTEFTCNWGCYGCTDPEADNYNPDLEDCAITQGYDAWGDPLCCEYEQDNISTGGCLNVNACNYNECVDNEGNPTPCTNWCNTTQPNGIGSELNSAETLPGDGDCCDFCSCVSNVFWCLDDYGYVWPDNAVGANILPPEVCNNDDFDPLTTTENLTQIQAQCTYVGCTDPAADASCYCEECGTSIFAGGGYDFGNPVDYSWDLNTDPAIGDIGCFFTVFGCTDSTAANYDSTANTDDGSCQYPIYGCMDVSATNYCEDCTDDDGSCTYPKYTCTDMEAINYNCDCSAQNICVDDGSCVYFTFGCMDPSACNYLGEIDVDNGFYPIDVQPLHLCWSCYNDTGCLGDAWEMEKWEDCPSPAIDELGYTQRIVKPNEAVAGTYSSGLETSLPETYPCVGTEPQGLVGNDNDYILWPPDAMVADSLPEWEIKPCWDVPAGDWGFCPKYEVGAFDNFVTNGTNCKYAAEGYDCDGNATSVMNGLPIAMQLSVHATTGNLTEASVGSALTYESECPFSGGDLGTLMNGNEGNLYGWLLQKTEGFVESLSIYPYQYWFEIDE